MCSCRAVSLLRLQRCGKIVHSAIFERSWQSGEVPDDLKKANAIAVFKDGWKEDLGNSRLVSFTLVPRKIIEQNLLGAISKVSFPRIHFLKGQEGNWEQPVWTYQGQIVPDYLLGRPAMWAR